MSKSAGLTALVGLMVNRLWAKALRGIRPCGSLCTSDKLKELGIEDNTIVMYSTDNGAETFTSPDGGTTMFRGEKNTQWEGGYRVPTLIRWPGTIKPGTVINDISAHEDMMTTLLAAAGEPNVKDELLKGRLIRRPDVQSSPRRL